MNTTLAGKRGEALAAEYLRKKGYTLLEAGYRSRYLLGEDTSNSAN